MRTLNKVVTIAAAFLIATVAGTLSAQAATNEATDPGGGGVTLTDSGTVTVTAAQLVLVKQVWDAAGANCLASIPAQAACNTSATTALVPAGSTVTFLIYVANIADVAVTDVRFQDVVDDTLVTGFAPIAGTMNRTPNDGTAPSDVATAATIIAAATTGQTDAVGAPDDFASFEDDGGVGGVLDNLTVGAVVGQVNVSLGFPAHRTFGITFQAVKN